ncbi:MAG: 16S rRNA (cytosine(1402)-N(4))-methyltransferase RsmH [Opitutales bacterium]|nr:16S rRNA (cytosine(1402)-N(4))-methyltransferase RsmH [Opitutales bacterium]
MPSANPDKAAKGSSAGHSSVLLNEAVRFLTEGERSGCFLDATFGGGGHCRALLEAHAANRVIAFDCDPEAIERSAALQQAYEGRLTLHHRNFDELAEVETGPLDGALFDLGLSSYHFDTPERGFSFRFAAPLDMRLNTEEGMTAREFLETADHEALVTAIRNYGEETRWRAVVDAIENARGTERLSDTLQFASLIESVVGQRRVQGRAPIHPATRSFQGIRIAVNRELEVIETALPVAFERLKTGARLVVISFHSLEDRIVKRFFRRMAGRPEHGRDNRPQQDRVVRGRELIRKPLRPSESEIAANPRARSACMRVIEKGELS